MMIPIAGVVAPFGYPRIKACSRLPWLFAACPRLRRLLVPRHPPNALLALNHPTCTETTHKPHSPQTAPSTQNNHAQSSIFPVPEHVPAMLHLYAFQHTGRSDQPTPRHVQKRTNLFTRSMNTTYQDHPARHRCIRTSQQTKQSDRISLTTYNPTPIASTHTPHFTAQKWWRRTGSNRRPPACKAGALPAELRPHTMVGQGGLEPPTPRLSSVCSNQLSY